MKEFLPVIILCSVLCPGADYSSKGGKGESSTRSPLAKPGNLHDFDNYGTLLPP